MNSQAMEDGGTAAELNQSRGTSAREALAILRAQVTGFKQRLSALNGYRTVSISLSLAMPVLVAIFLIAAQLHWIPRVSVFLVAAVAAVLAFGVCHVWRRYYFGACAELYRDCYRENRRFRLEQDAILISEPSGMTSRVPWSAIRNVVSDDNLLMIYLTPVHSIPLPKAACEGQDVEAFGAELVRRWNANRALLQPESAR